MLLVERTSAIGRFAANMGRVMVSVAMMYLMLLEPFLAVKLGEISEPDYRTEKQDRILQYPEKLAKFYLFKRERQSRTLDLSNHESFENFDPSLDTKVIIHGFLDKVRIADWMHEMKDEFLKIGDFNVIIVDWSSGNSIPYSKAAGNTARVGQEIADLLAHLRAKFGARTETFHLIGHSLGSHVSGFVGEHIKPLGRITGLDPAMYHFRNESPRKRLDPSDAIFVDAIHTDAGGIGIVEPVGHIDFYPNGGSLQPGCTATNYVTSLVDRGVVESVRSLICSHMRAIMLFTESINSRTCQMAASRCSSWKEYEDGKCNDCGPNGKNCEIMGYHTDVNRREENATFYLYTNPDPPYCVFEYRLKIADANDSPARRFLPTWRNRDFLGKNTFLVTLIGSRGEVEFLLDETNKVGDSSYVITTSTILGNVDSAILKWIPKPVQKALGVISKVTRQKSAYPLISFVEVKLENLPLDRNTRFVLCSSPSTFDSQRSIVGLRSSYC